MMKLLLLLSLISVLTVNGLYFSEIGKDQLKLELRNTLNATTAQPSGNCESNGGECKKNKKQCKGTINTEYTCSKNGVCCIAESKAQGASELMLQLLSNTILIQGMAMQTLKEDQENSMKNLNNTMSNLKLAVEIKNSNLSDAISVMKSNLSEDISFLKSNLSDAISNEGMVIQLNQDSIMSNLSDGFSDQENMLENMEDNQDIIMSNLTHISCPKGFFQLSPSSQCLKFFYDQKRTWYEANSKCQTEGLVSAKPSDPATLQKYLVNKYGYHSSKSWPYVWIPAQGSGSNFFYWKPSNTRIYYYSPYWYSAPSSSSRFSASHCIYMLNSDNYMKSYPGKPYWYNTCSGRYYYAICELVKE